MQAGSRRQPAGPFAKSTTAPPGWDSEAFCAFLAVSKSSHTFVCEGVRGLPPNMYGAVRNMLSLLPPPIAGYRDLQSRIYKSLCSVVPDSWPALLSRRVEVLAPEATPYELREHRSDIDLILKNLGPARAMSIIKTWTNAWTTSRRYHEATILPCIFGCNNAEDDLAHYLTCDPLWTLTTCAGKKPKSVLGLLPGVKIGLVNPTHESIKMAVVLSRAYHTIRNTFMDEILLAVNSGDFWTVHSRLLEILSSEWEEFN